MYLDALSVSLLQLCDRERLSYEDAAERIGYSSRYFGQLVRRKSSPSLRILEKICAGFHLTPNEILRIYDASREILYRIPLQVNAVRAFSSDHYVFPLCPRCGEIMEREYQAYCDHCGQSLGWNEFRNAAVIQFSAVR